jgi:hypothetical protein
MDYYKALRTVALQEVLSDTPSQSYSLRRIFRWYSQKFCTPLHVVNTLPIHDVLVSYFESHYEEFGEDKIQEELRELTMTPAQLLDAEMAKAAEALSELEFSKSIEKEIAETKNRPVVKKTVTHSRGGIPLEKPVEVEKPVKPPDEIKMSFLDIEEFDKILSADAEAGFDSSVSGLK